MSRRVVGVVDVVAVGIAAEGVVLAREDAGHARRGRCRVHDGWAVPVGGAERLQRRQVRVRVHRRGHRAGRLPVYRRDLVLLLYQAGRRVVQRGPLRGAVGVGGGGGRPCKRGWCEMVHG